MTTSDSIACTLTLGDRAERVAWIAALNRAHLRHHRQDELRLELTYGLAATAEVDELVRRERECCSFLRFAVEQRSDVLLLRIEAPRETREVIDAVFEPFLAGAPPD